MSNPDDERSDVIASPKTSKIQDDFRLRPDLIAIALQNEEGAQDLKIFRTLINIKTRLEDPQISTTWNPVIVELLRIISSSDDVGCEQVLMASLALINLSFRTRELDDFTGHLKIYWTSEVSISRISGREFQIRDAEWFKLAIIHGYLRANIKTIYSEDTMSMAFEILRRNCLRYTKYSYFAHKALQVWLNKSTTTNFWHDNYPTSMENDVEAIIFSNWDSSILEIAQINSTQLFPTYLRIMNEKYEGFLDFAFDKCMQNLSWQNDLKYTILAEICKTWNDLSKIVRSELPSCLFTSLTKNHLKYPGTKLYLTILGKLEANDWQEIFSESLFRISAIWETEEQSTAIELLWDQWMKPTIEKFPTIFEFLWKHDSMSRLKINKSYLEKIGDRHGFQLIYENTKIEKILHSRVIHISESVRLNAFAILSQLQNWKINVDATHPFGAMQKFLFHNVDTTSISMRKGIVKNFEFFFGNLVKLAERDINVESRIRQFLRWLHEFFVDCFEIGSSYRRKILALSLYEIVLIPTSCEDCRMGLWNAKNCKRERRKFIKSARRLRKKEEEDEEWIYCNVRSLRIFFSLVYDEINEVREKACFMICQYFSKDVLPAEELQYCWELNEEYYKSTNSCKIEIAATAEKLRNLWGITANPPLYNDRLSTIVNHIQLARKQLRKMHESQKRMERYSPVHGSLTIILEVGFLIGPVGKIYDESTVRQILELAEDVTKLCMLRVSTKTDENNFSSSLDDVERAEEPFVANIDGNATVWMSIKVSTQIAAELGLIAENEEIARRSVDLIVSVLLKCRHKGAIEAAGLALAKLTKGLSMGNYNGSIESHLTDLLNIGDEQNTNMTRRGAGLTIMFHRILSNDGRRNKPWLHIAVQKLLALLAIDVESSTMQIQDRPIDFAKARHLHFFRSLVADKELQTQLLPYIEDICLTCFENLQSLEWTVRNASLQLFGAIVPRLVGQCNARELDYGVGNSVDHFITHYPILAKTLMMRLKSRKNSLSPEYKKNPNDNHIDSIVVPILTLLSKMSTGGCELVDHSSAKYLSEAKKIFVALFDHPVINVRSLAGKAYAAFVPFPEIPHKLTELQLQSLSVDKTKTTNRIHGQFCAQLYLEKKLKHESQCTSSTFVIRRQKNCEYIVGRGSHLQLRLLGRIVVNWTKYKRKISYTIVSALIRCLLESPLNFSPENLPIDWTRTHVEISKMIEERWKPGFAEFLEDLMSLSAKIRVVHDTRMLSNIFHERIHCYEHRTAVMKKLRTERCNLEIFIDEAETINRDLKKSDYLLILACSIRDIIFEDCNNDEIPKELKRRIRRFSYFLQLIEEKTYRPYARQLIVIGCCIASRMENNEYRFDKELKHIYESVYDDDEASKQSLMDYLSRFVATHENKFESIFVASRGQFLWCKFILLMIGLFTNDDSTMKERMAMILQPVTQFLIGGTDEPIFAKASCYKILDKLTDIERKLDLAYDEVPAIFMKLTLRHDDSKIFPNTVEQNDLSEPDASFLNLLYYSATKLMKKNRISACEETDNEDIRQIDGSIQAKYKIHRRNDPNFGHLKFILNSRTSNYLETKKLFLRSMIDNVR